MGEPPRRRKPGQPSEQDLALWRHVVRDAEPLRRRLPATATDPSRAEPPTVSATGPAPRSRPALRASTAPAPAAPPPPAPPPELAHGNVAGLDKRKAQRLRRGLLPIEARLDLHGLTQAEAHAALVRFVARSAAAGRRCVLVITGKGRGRGETVGEMGGELGVLRRQVPLWLNQAELRDKVLAFDYARPEHGGQGAIYLLLRRRREDEEGA